MPQSAYCVVVRLDLQYNNMVGSLPDSLGQLESLQYIDLTGNKLTGVFPQELVLRASVLNRGEFQAWARLESLKIGEQNRDIGFTYPIGGANPLTCLDLYDECEGMPPNQCSAYGTFYKTSSADINECVQCGSQAFAIFAVAGISTGFFMMAAMYAWFTIKYPDSTTQFVSTASILLSHMQTMNLIGRMKLTWPPSSSTALQLFAVDGFSFEAGRPECIFVGNTQDWLAPVLQVIRLAFPLVFLLFFMILRRFFRSLVVRMVRLKQRLRPNIRAPTKMCDVKISGRSSVESDCASVDSADDFGEPLGGRVDTAPELPRSDVARVCVVRQSNAGPPRLASSSSSAFISGSRMRRRKLTLPGDPDHPTSGSALSCGSSSGYLSAVGSDQSSGSLYGSAQGSAPPSRATSSCSSLGDASRATSTLAGACAVLPTQLDPPMPPPPPPEFEALSSRHSQPEHLSGSSSEDEHSEPEHLAGSSSDDEPVAMDPPPPSCEPPTPPASPPTSPPSAAPPVDEVGCSRWVIPRLGFAIQRPITKPTALGPPSPSPPDASGAAGARCGAIACVTDALDKLKRPKNKRRPNIAQRGRRGAVGLKGNKRLKDYKLDIWICDKEDKLELLETMVFSLMIVSSWETIATFMKHGYTDVLYGSSILSVGPITIIGFICASVLLILEMALLIKYGMNMHSLVQAEDGARRRLSQLPNNRLNERMRFIQKRFETHAPYWQFVVWGRQLMLFFMTILPDATVKRGSTMVAVVANSTNTTEQHSSSTVIHGTPRPEPWSIYTAAGIGIVVLLLSWWLHVHTHPYRYKFQNYVESGLFFTAIIVIILGCLYSILHNEYGYSGIHIDVVMVTILIGSVVIAAANLTWNYRKHQKEIAAAASNMMKGAAAATEQLARNLSSFSKSAKKAVTRRGKRLGLNISRKDSSEAAASYDPTFRRRHPLERSDHSQASQLSSSSTASDLHQAMSSRSLSGFLWDEPLPPTPHFHADASGSVGELPDIREEPSTRLSAVDESPVRPPTVEDRLAGRVPDSGIGAAARAAMRGSMVRHGGADEPDDLEEHSVHIPFPSSAPTPIEELPSLGAVARAMTRVKFLAGRFTGAAARRGDRHGHAEPTRMSIGTMSVMVRPRRAAPLQPPLRGPPVRRVSFEGGRPDGLATHSPTRTRTRARTRTPRGLPERDVTRRPSLSRDSSEHEEAIGFDVDELHAALHQTTRPAPPPMPPPPPLTGRSTGSFSFFGLAPSHDAGLDDYGAPPPPPPPRTPPPPVAATSRASISPREPTTAQRPFDSLANIASAARSQSYREKKVCERMTRARRQRAAAAAGSQRTHEEQPQVRLPPPGAQLSNQRKRSGSIDGTISIALDATHPALLLGSARRSSFMATASAQSSSASLAGPPAATATVSSQSSLPERQASRSPRALPPILPLQLGEQSPPAQEEQPARGSGEGSEPPPWANVKLRPVCRGSSGCSTTPRASGRESGSPSGAPATPPPASSTAPSAPSAESTDSAADPSTPTLWV